MLSLGLMEAVQSNRGQTESRLLGYVFSMLVCLHNIKMVGINYNTCQLRTCCNIVL